MADSESKTAAPSSQRLRAFPVQMVGAVDGVILVRGAARFKITGRGVTPVVQQLISACFGHGATREQLRAHFAVPDQPQIDELVEELVRRRFLENLGATTPVDCAVPADSPEASAEVFYWNFGVRAAQVEKQLSERRLCVLGVNAISRQLTQSLHALGFTVVDIVDVPLARNTRMFVDGAPSCRHWPETLPVPMDVNVWEAELGPTSFDCVVATSDHGGSELMRHWNRVCVVNRRPFLPVVLRDLVGHVGPLVVPGETACYECLWSRENSNLGDPEAIRVSERAAFAGQAVDGFLPPMASILGDLAALELLKFLGGTLPLRVGSLIEVKTLSATMQPRKLLKMPRCAVCSALIDRGRLSLEVADFRPIDAVATAAQIAADN